MLATVIRDERYAVVIAIAKEHDHLPESTVYCLKICDFKGDEPIRIEGVPFILDDYNNGSPIWEDFCLRSQSIEVGSIIKVENRRDWYVGNTGKKMGMTNILSQLRFGNGNHGVVFHGIKEAFPDAVVAPDGIYQDTKPRRPYALISVVSGFTGNDHQLSTLTRLEERISLKNHSHGQLSIKQGFFQVQEQLLSKDDVGDVILVAFGSTTSLGLKYQAICMGLLSSGTGQWEKILTGVILAVSKQDESSSMIYAREVDTKFIGNGQPFQLWNRNGSVWQNEYVSAERLAIGSLVTFKKYHGFSCVYFNKVDVNSQDVTKIQMDLDYTECIFLGISDAFPKAKIHTKGLSMDEMPTPCIAAIGMKSACIKNERIEFTSCRGEQVSLKLLCREHLQLSASTIELQLRSSSDNLQDVALVKFAETQHSLRHPTYSAVCVGLLLKFSPTVISITEEPVEIQHGNGTWTLVPGEVLFDTGNEMATGISEKLVDKLDLQPDRSKQRKVVTGGGKEFPCSRVAIEIKIRGHTFKVDNALVGAPAPNTDLLIGKDVIDQLIDRKYTFGE